MPCCMFLSSVTSFLLPDTLPRLSGHIYCSSLLLYMLIFHHLTVSENGKNHIWFLCLYSRLAHSRGACCCSVVQSCPTLCNPMDCSTQASLSSTIWSLLTLMSIESVMPSNHLILCHPLLFLSSVPQHQDLFQWVSSSHQVVKVLEVQLQHQSFQWIFRTDFL